MFYLIRFRLVYKLINLLILVKKNSCEKEFFFNMANFKNSIYFFGGFHESFFCSIEYNL